MEHDLDAWPSHLPVAQTRIARPTADLDATARFYRDDLGLEQLAGFRDYDGYDGVVLGLPGTAQLELTFRADEAPPPASSEHQLVLYFDGAAAMAIVADRLRARPPAGDAGQPVLAASRLRCLP